jgi:hypothetical protein
MRAFSSVISGALVLAVVSCSSGTEPDELVQQWASSAVASSQYDTPDYGPQEATGAPDMPQVTTNCPDEVEAWASQTANGVDWIELSYAQAVRPTAIKVHEYWSPGQITKIEVKLSDGTYQTVYTAQPADPGVCARVLTANVTGITASIRSVRITVDQQARNDWNEIDAVQLIGYR